MDATEQRAALMKRVDRGILRRKIGIALGVSSIPAFGLAMLFVENMTLSLCLLFYAPTAVLVGLFVTSDGDNMRRRALQELGIPAHLGPGEAPLPIARVVERDD